MHCNYRWSFKHALNIVPSKNLTYFKNNPIIQHKVSILKEFYAMPPDSLRTELHYSLTCSAFNFSLSAFSVSARDLKSSACRRLMSLEASSS